VVAGISFGCAQDRLFSKREKRKGVGRGVRLSPVSTTNTREGFLS